MVSAKRMHPELFPLPYGTDPTIAPPGDDPAAQMAMPICQSATIAHIRVSLRLWFITPLFVAARCSSPDR
jgi:hypothetical protein